MCDRASIRGLCRFRDVMRLPDLYREPDFCRKRHFIGVAPFGKAEFEKDKI
jgi:hypothetical protein